MTFYYDPMLMLHDMLYYAKQNKQNEYEELIHYEQSEAYIGFAVIRKSSDGSSFFRCSWQTASVYLSDVTNEIIGTSQGRQKLIKVLNSGAIHKLPKSLYESLIVYEIHQS